jgi:glyoxylase-like metal-dependent hydrolase (beta-lactamase superfamily II)
MTTQSDRVLPIEMGIVKAFLVRGARPVLVDTGTSGSGPVILERIAEYGVDPGSISLILLTHGHLDHAGGAKLLRERTGAPVAVGRGDADPLRRDEHPRVRSIRPLGWLLRPFLLQSSVSHIPPFEPDLLIDGEMDLEPFGVAGRVVPTPGHSPGSVSMVLDSGEAVVGDLIMGGLLRQKRPAYPLFAHDLDQLRESIRKLMRLAPRRIWPSHGGPLEPEAVLRRFPWIVEG